MADINLDSPFHAGEQKIQQTLGKRALMQKVGKAFIRSYMPDQHREFYLGLSYVFVGYVDDNLRPWGAIAFKKYGLITVSNETELTIDLSQMPAGFVGQFKDGMQVGLLGLDLSNKRRNRLTGRIVDTSNNRLKIEVNQTFGNCPKYITPREINKWQPERAKCNIQQYSAFNLFTNEVKQLINKSDTFFVASYYDDQNNATPSNGTDVSHRGGEPGFVETVGNTQLIIPDYVGNNFFNTLGNIEQTGKAGLLFIDFETGDILTISGKAEILWDAKNVDATKGSKRLWQFTLQQGFFHKQYLPFNFSDLLIHSLG